MVTISHIVSKIVKKQPFLEEALLKGIINYGALADTLLEEVEKELGKPVKHSAVMMALRRHTESNKLLPINKVSFDEQTDLLVRSNLIEITIFKSIKSGEVIKKLYDCVDPKSGDIITIIAGISEISIITNENNEKKFLKLIDDQDIRGIIRGLSIITTRIPQDAIENVGMFYLLTKALNWININIIEIISTWTEMGFIIETKHVPEAFKVMQQVIEEHKVKSKK